jgi:hypothetical protein
MAHTEDNVPNASEGSKASGASDALRELLGWLPNNLSTLPALLGLAGLLAYGALNVASTVFYQGLGVTPSAVGLGYGELLARVAVIAAIVAATALGCAAAIALAVSRAVKWIGVPRTRGRGRLMLLSVGLAGVLAFDVLISAVPPLSFELSWADVFALAIFDVLVAIAVLVIVNFFEKELARICEIELRTVLTAGAVWLLLAPLSFVAHAIVGTNEVQDGRRESESLFGSPFPWQVVVADVTWKGPKSQPPRVPRCLLYLGASGNVAVFYDATSDERRSIQVPTADVIVQLYPEKTSCPVAGSRG